MSFDIETWAEHLRGMDVYQKVANLTSSMRPESGLRVLEDRDTRVIRSEHTFSCDFARLDHAVSGICSEAGELAEHIKHVRFHGKALDVEHVVKEIGDVLWYCAEGAAAISIPLAAIAARNVVKLARRYPEGYFTVERSEHRDTSKE